MKVLITGATGLVGRKLCLELAKQGHELRILSRNKARAQQTLQLPAEYYDWDPMAGPPPSESLSGVEAVVNLMGENLAGKRWSTKQKQKIRDSRIIGTQN